MLGVLQLICSPKLLQRLRGTVLVPLLARNPERLLVLHNIRKDSTSKEDHVLSTRWIFDTDFEFLANEITGV